MSKSMNELLEKLSAPFPASEIEWRVQQAKTTSDGGAKALVLPYITARAVMNRLDDVFGLFWSNHTVFNEYGAVCTITVTFATDSGSVTTSRCDCAEFTDVEKFKGAASDAMKRAAVHFGIGRYLYSLPQYKVPVTSQWAPGAIYVYSEDKRSGVVTKGYWHPPTLPDWALPHGAPLEAAYSRSPKEGLPQAAQYGEAEANQTSVLRQGDNAGVAARAEAPRRSNGSVGGDMPAFPAIPGEFSILYAPPYKKVDPVREKLKADKKIRWDADSKMWKAKEEIPEWDEYKVANGSLAAAVTAKLADKAVAATSEPEKKQVVDVFGDDDVNF